MGDTQFELDGKVYKFEIKKLGQEHCSPNKKAEKRKRSYYSLHFVMYGMGTLMIGNEKIFLGKGNVFLLHAGEEYEYYPDSIEPWTYVWIDFEGEELDSLFVACGLTKEKPYLRIIDYAGMVDIVKSLLEGYDGGVTQSMVCSAYTMLFLSKLIQHHNRNAHVGVRGSVRFKQFRDILIYVNNNYCMNLSLEQLAEDVHLSVKQIISMFRDYTGYTPINYINKMRISSACMMLKTTDYKIEKVAEMVGVENEKYFSRMFTQLTGVSPREYRKNCGDDDPYAWLKEKNIDFR